VASIIAPYLCISAVIHRHYYLTVAVLAVSLASVIVTKGRSSMAKCNVVVINLERRMQQERLQALCTKSQ